MTDEVARGHGDRRFPQEIEAPRKNEFWYAELFCQLFMAETLLESLTAQVSEHVVSYVTTKILPAIAKKYNLSLDELLVVVRGIDNTPVKAVPKSVPQAAVKASLVASISKSKIDKARAEGKYLNIVSGRPLGDSAVNRRKYTFLEDLGIAGPIGDPLLEQIAAQLRGTEGGEAKGDGAPVHVQAAAAKAAAKAGVVTKPPVIVAKPKPKVAKSMDSASEDTSAAGSISIDGGGKVIEEDARIQPSMGAETLDDLSDDTESGEELPGKKAIAKTSGAKELDSASEDEIKVEAPPPVVPKEDTVADIVQMSNAIDEHLQQPSPKFNTKLKRWWLPEYMFLLDKKKTSIVGKITPESTIIPLADADLQFCKKNKWALGAFEG